MVIGVNFENIEKCFELEKTSKMQYKRLCYIFFGPPAVDGRVLWNMIYLSFHPSVCSGFFLELCQFFSNFWHGGKNPYEVVLNRAGFSEKIFFAPKIRKMGQKQGFYNLLKICSFLLICSVMKISIICCVPAQIPYMGKSLRYRSKCS